MMTVEMICTQPVEYRNVRHDVGDKFDVDERDVELLRHLDVAVLSNGAGEPVVLPGGIKYEEKSVPAGDARSLEQVKYTVDEGVAEPAAEAPVKRKRGRPRKVTLK